MHFHQKILEHLKKYREQRNSNFNFLVRQRARTDDKNFPGGKFAHGIVFQGNDNYCSVGLIDKGAGNNSTRSVGLLFEPNDRKFSVWLHVTFKKEKNKKVIEFYKALASMFENTKWRAEEDAIIPICEIDKNDPTLLYQWLDENYPKIRSLALETAIEKLIPSDKKYYKLQERLENKLKESNIPINCWLFQGNPKIFDFESALSEGALDNFNVAAHRDKMNIGDKVIIWLSGKNAGCYALAKIITEPRIVDKSKDDRHWKQKNSNETKVGIQITHNLYKNPILWSDIKSSHEFENLNAGHQGTNFSASKKEFEAFLNIIKARDNMQYWLYSPGESAKYWDEFYEKGIMALGWDELGDLKKYDGKESIREAIQSAYNVEGSNMNNTLANFEFCKELEDGDIVIAKKGSTEYLGYGIVTSDYYYDENRFEFKSCRNVSWKKKGVWYEENIVQKTLTNITKYPDYVERLKKLLDIEQNENTIIDPNFEMHKTELPLNQILFGPPGTGKTYKLQSQYFQKFTQYETKTTKEDYLVEQMEALAWWQVLFIALLDLGEVGVNKILAHPAVQAKAKSSSIKNLQASIWGALQRHTKQECPHVNVVSRALVKPFWKTENSDWHLFSNDEIDLFPEAQSILDKYNNYEKSSGQKIQNYTFVTFHQSFTYEDFVEGIKPVLEDENEDIRYEISDGVFKKLALKAQNDPDNKYAIFIDEINRGNVAAIFGELITLIEADKRLGAENALSVVLPYSKTKFLVPQNLYIIGTMNTADRSIEALDSALRRRFEFIEMLPNYKVIDQLLSHQKYQGFKLSDILKTINERITVLINRDHQIGHSYFLKLKDSTDLENDLKQVFMNKIIPLLQEYFFNDYIKIAMVIGEGFLDKDQYKNVTFASNDGDYESDYSDTTIYEIKKEVDIKQAITLLMGNQTDD